MKISVTELKGIGDLFRSVKPTFGARIEFTGPKKARVVILESSETSATQVREAMNARRAYVLILADPQMAFRVVARYFTAIDRERIMVMSYPKSPQDATKIIHRILNRDHEDTPEE